VTVSVTQSAGLPTVLRSPSRPEPNRAVPVITYTSPTGAGLELRSPSAPAPSRAVPVIALPTQTAGVPTEFRSPSGPSPNRAVPVITLATSTTGLRMDMTSPSGPAPNHAVPVITAPRTQNPGVVLPVQPMIPKVEPGSLYVLQTQDPNDPKRKVFGVYMVTNNEPKVGSSPSHEPVPLVGDAAKTPSDSMSPSIIQDPVEGTVLTKL